jgi:pimeloyl-ACP methyl ester carboxylesterase
MDVLEQRLIDVDGAQVEVFRGGSDGPLLCQSHPFDPLSAEPDDPSSGWWDWDPTLGRLVRVNPRGVGQSTPDWQPNDVTFAQHIDDLEAVRQQLGGEPWVYWGASGGSIIGPLCALRYPDALRGMILAAIVPSGRQIAEDPRSVLSPLHAEHQDAIAHLMQGSSSAHRPAVLGGLEPALADAAWVRLGEDEADDRWVLMQGSRPLVVDGGEPRMWAAFEQFVTTFDVRDRLREIRIPALIMAGRQDPLFPLAHVEQLHAGLPQATLLVLEETEHDLDRATADGERSRAAVRHFLAGLPLER